MRSQPICKYRVSTDCRLARGHTPSLRAHRCRSAGCTLKAAGQAPATRLSNAVLNRLSTSPPTATKGIVPSSNYTNLQYNTCIHVIYIIIYIYIYKVCAKSIAQYRKNFVSLNFVSGYYSTQSFYAQRWNLSSQRVISLSQVNPVIYY